MINTLRRRLGFLKNRVVSAFVRPAASSPLAARQFYGVLSGRFAREQRAVLAGIARYRRDVSQPTGARTVLRRNVHRLEKGLTMQPRNPVFATDYIGETVTAFATASGAASDPGADENELQWARSVLTRYFETVEDSHDAVKAARVRFAAIGATCTPDGDRAPYRRNIGELPRVTYDDFYALCRRRRSVRFFLDRPVDRELIDKALLAAAQAPSACNRQPFQFRIFEDREMVAKVASLALGAGGFAHRAPVLIVLVGSQRMFFDERDRHVIYIDSALAAMAFMLALETLGLSSCPINWPDVETSEAAMAKLIGLDDDERPILLIAVGHPDPEALVAFSEKKGLKQLRRFG